MNNSEFQYQIIRFKRYFILKQIFIFAINSGLLFLIFLSIFYIIKAYLPYHHLEKPYIFIVLAGIASVLSLAYTLITDKNVLSKLIEIDTRLDLKDRLSSAYEFSQLTTKSSFVYLLMKDATIHLSKLKFNQIVPIRIPIVQVIITVICGTFLFIKDFIPLPWYTTDIISNQSTIRAMEKIIQEYEHKTNTNQKGKNSKKREKYLNDANSLVRSLQKRSLSPPEVKDSVKKILQELISNKKNLVKKLGKQLQNRNIDTVSIVPKLRYTTLSQNSLDSLKNMIKRLMGNKLPSSMEKALDDLKDNIDGEQFLNQLSDKLDTDNKDNSKPMVFADNDNLNKELKRQRQKSQKLDQSKDNSNSEPSNDSSNNNDSPFDEPPTKDRNNKKKGSGKSRDAFGVGKGKTSDKEQSPYKIETAKGPTMREKIPSFKAKTYNMHIRSITEIGSANTRKVDVEKEYIQEIESVLQKEKLPENYRHFIKNYFLSIGLEGNK